MSNQTAEISQYITPDWPVPSQVKALVTTRVGGVSQAPYDNFNLGFHVGDERAAVIANREALHVLLNTPYEPQWLQQVHGTEVCEAQTDGIVREADAAITSTVGLPCAVMTADCLPVFFSDHSGDRVGIAHAGWRGLANGVLDATLEQMRCPAESVLAWFGPAIGPQQFEVGQEVFDAFVSRHPQAERAFTVNRSRAEHWFADLYELATIRLQSLGVRQIYGGGFCTYSEPECFYSYRRDGVTGRMASLIWLED